MYFTHLMMGLIPISGRNFYVKILSIVLLVTFVPMDKECLEVYRVRCLQMTSNTVI